MKPTCFINLILLLTATLSHGLPSGETQLQSAQEERGWLVAAVKQVNERIPHRT